MSFYQEIENFSKDILFNRNMSSYFKRQVKSRYGIPEWVSLEWLNSDPLTLDEVDLYCLATCLEDTTEKYKIKKSFSKYIKIPNDILKKIEAKYGNRKSDKKIYPLIFDNCLRVNEDQWVTTVTAKQLDRLEKDGVIYYNKNTQRQMTRRIVSGEDTYTVTLKKRAVNEIARDMEHGLFISNAITLNINEDDVDTSYEYDETTSQIIVSEGKLDIIDGYHRFRAMMKNVAEIEGFDYPMILNIVAFSEEKANRYIVQEDKRNKINQLHLRSINSLNEIGQLINRINTTVGCTYGKIGREDETNKISRTQLHQWIEKSLKIEDKKDVIKYKNIFIEIFNHIDEERGDIAQLTFCQLGVIVICISKYPDNPEIAMELIDKVLLNYCFDESRFARKVVNKRSIEAIREYVNEKEKVVCEHV